MKIPEGYQRVMPYLILENADGFMKFAKSIFGATEKMKVNREGEEVIMHAEVMIGDCTIMFANSTEQFPVMNSNMFIYVEDVDKTYNEALEAGSSSLMPPAEQEYGRSCGIQDPYGNVWWVTSVPDRT